MKMKRENLMIALEIAILKLEEVEKKVGSEFKSGMRAGFEEVHQALRVGEPIEVVD